MSKLEEQARKEIIVAEDDDGVREFIGTVISRYLKDKYEVRTARNGKEALDEMGKGRPEMVISDIEMGEMNGIALLEKIKNDEKYKNLKIIIISGYLDEYKEKLKGYNIKTLEKPFSVKQLTDAIESFYTAP